MVKSFKEFSGTQQLDEFAPVPEDQIPAIFATIHFKSEDRPNGYEDHDISRMNVIANRHIPELYQSLKDDHNKNHPDHQIED